jgi:peroxiredoxin
VAPSDRAADAAASQGLPTPISRSALPSPVVLGLTPQTEDVSMTVVSLGQAAPDFTLPTLDGAVLTLSDLRGRPVVLNFWASWCVPCRVEMPALAAAYEQYRSEGLVIIAFNVTYQDSLPAVEAFVEEFKLPFPVVLDKEGHVTADDYQLRGLPMSIFIDRDGIITQVQLGAMTENQIGDFLKELLAD